jgi:penicillin-binding protein 1A
MWFSKRGDGTEAPETAPAADLPPPLPPPLPLFAGWLPPFVAIPPPAAARAPGEPPAPSPAPSLFQRLSWRTRAALFVCGGGSLAALFTLAVMLAYYSLTLPNPMNLRQKERAPVIRILARDGAVLAERGAAHDYMPLDLLPAHVVGAVVATEDRRFYEHWGLDEAGLIRAFFANLRAGRFAQGGSTLTQQLAKNLFLSPERTLTRKLEELVLAIWLELKLSKHDILELYLNRVYFGAGAYGIEAAAQRYFDKSARELTLAEAALIAGLLKAPSKYSPVSSPGAARTRGRSVLAKMRAAGVITAEQETRALEERVRFANLGPSKDVTGNEYAIDFVLERLPPLVGSGYAEVVVETTIDSSLQRKATAVLQRQLARHGTDLGVDQGAVLICDLDGGILALVGGRDYADSQFNRAVKARRQPGSAFKPFVYLAALENGLTPDTTSYDLPFNVDGWAPRNDNGQYVGAVPLRRALAHSINTVAARLQMDVGSSRVVNVARRLGITSELRDDPSLALGTSEVSLMEMVGAFGVFANGGSAIQPHAIRRVRMSSGRVLFAREAPRTQQVVAAAHVAAMNDMLSAAVSTGTGRRAALPRHATAGKTGTTQDFRDAWFVGFTGHLAGGVWVGNDNGRPMNKVMGGSLPAEIWREVMAAAHEGKAPLALPGSDRAGALVAEAKPLPPLSNGNEAEAPATAPRGEPPAAATSAQAASAPRQDGAQTSAAATAQARPAKPQLRPAAPKTPRLPSHRIDDAFIARVLNEQRTPPLRAGDAMAQANRSAPGDAARAPEAAAQLPASPPPSGMMALGAGLRKRDVN